MTITLTLHCIDREEILFEGVPIDCPPVPHIGSQIECDGKVYHLEGIRHVFSKDALAVHLMT